MTTPGRRLLHAIRRAAITDFMYRRTVWHAWRCRRASVALSRHRIKLRALRAWAEQEKQR